MSKSKRPLVATIIVMLALFLDLHVAQAQYPYQERLRYVTVTAPQTSTGNIPAVEWAMTLPVHYSPGGYLSQVRIIGFGGFDGWVTPYGPITFRQQWLYGWNCRFSFSFPYYNGSTETDWEQFTLGGPPRSCSLTIKERFGPSSDQVPPAITISQPANGRVPPGTTHTTIVGTVSDASAIVGLTISGPGLSNRAVSISTTSPAAFTCAVNLPTTPSLFSFAAYDDAGNTGRLDFSIQTATDEPPNVLARVPDWVPRTYTSISVTGIATDDNEVSKILVNNVALPESALRRQQQGKVCSFATLVPVAAGLTTEIRVQAEDNGAHRSDTLILSVRSDNVSGIVPSPICVSTAGWLTELANQLLEDFVAGYASLHFQRRYASRDPYVGPLGRGWTHSFNAQLVECADETGAYVWVRLPCQRRAEFRQQPDGTYLPTRQHDFQLERDANGTFVLLVNDGRRFTFNGQGFVAECRDANGNATSFAYSEDGKLAEVDDPQGNRLSFAYVGRQLTGVSDQTFQSTGRYAGYAYTIGALGNPLLASAVVGGPGVTCSLSYTYNAQELLAATFNGDGQRQAAYSYDPNGLVTSTTVGQLTKTVVFELASRILTTTDSLGRTTVASLTPDNLPVWERDAAGALRQYEYHPTLRAVTRYVDPFGNEKRFSFSEGGNLTDVLNADGTSKHASWTVVAGKNVLLSTVDEADNVTTYSHDAAGNTTCVVDPLGYRMEFTYSPKGMCLSEKGSRGFVTRFEYEPGTGNLVRIVDPLGHAVVRSYDQLGNLVAVTDERGSTSDFEYDALRRCTKVVSPPDQDGQRAVTQYEYNQDGSVTKIIDPQGNETKNFYDQYGQLVETEDALGHKMHRTYDLAGRLIAETDVRGSSRSYSYDSVDRLMEVSGPQGVVLANSYDAEGRLLSTRDGDGNAISYSYDSRAHLLAVQDAGGGTTAHTYDRQGRSVATVEPSGETIQREFDALGRTLVTRRVSNGGVLEVRQEYDGVGNVVTRVDEAGRTTRSTWDPCSRLSAIVNPMGGIRRWEYDPTGELSKFIDENGGEWTIVRDGLGRVLRQRDPLGQETIYRYDLAGRVVEKTEPSGQSTRYGYDALGGCTRVDYADGEWAERTYDAAGNVTSLTGSDGTVLTQAFDAAGRLTSVTNSALQRRLSYSYTPGGLRSSSTVANLLDGTVRTTSYAWGPDGRLTGITPWMGSPISLSYDTGGRRTGVDLGNGITASLGRDAFGRLIAIEHRNGGGQLVSFLRYTRDALGNFSALIDSEGLTEYSFDRGSRLTEVRYPDGAWERFTLDAVGNRLTSENSAGPTRLVYDAANRLQSEAGVRNALYTWDADGNLVAKTDAAGATQYAWSARNKLMRVALPDSSSREFAYYPESDLRRRARSSDGTDVSLLWDDQNVAEEVDGQGISTGAFVNGTGLDERFTYLSGGNAYSVVADAVGSVRALLDPAGVPTNRYSYHAFGAPRVTQEAFAFPYRFGGQPWDDGAGLSYFRARYLDPGVARFVARDPLGQEDGYSYAAGDPIGRSDPTGLRIAPPSTLGDTALFAQALPILIENATETYPKLSDANYGIRLNVSPALGPVLPDEPGPALGMTGGNLLGNPLAPGQWLQQDSRGVDSRHGGTKLPFLLTDYYTHIRDGFYYAPCPPEVPLNAHSFDRTLSFLKTVVGVPRLEYAKHIKRPAWHAIVLYHEALHALHFDWGNPALNAQVRTELHERIRASQRNFYWSIYEADLRHISDGKQGRLFDNATAYTIYGEGWFGPYGAPLPY